MPFSPAVLGHKFQIEMSRRRKGAIIGKETGPLDSEAAQVTVATWRNVVSCREARFQLLGAEAASREVWWRARSFGASGKACAVGHLLSLDPRELGGRVGPRHTTMERLLRPRSRDPAARAEPAQGGRQPPPGSPPRPRPAPGSHWVKTWWPSKRFPSWQRHPHRHHLTLLVCPMGGYSLKTDGPALRHAASPFG